MDVVIKKEGDEKLYVKFLILVDSKDVYVIDIKYYKNCWIKYVINVFCKLFVILKIE